MSKKTSIHFTISKSNYEFIKMLKEERDYNSLSTTIDNIITDYKEKIHLNQSDTIKLISDQIYLSTVNYFEDELKKIRVALNGIDLDTKTIIEVINGILILKNIGGDEELAVTNELESEVLIKAKKVVKERIFDYKYKNDGALY